ncbi:MAG: phosphatase PAP2 family protein, partial [archaeon]|nr:phosphatase PAP2 family protein [archaeon]
MFEALQAEAQFTHLLQGFATPALDSFFIVITHLGNPLLWMALSAFLFWKGDEKKSFFLATAILFISALVGVLKPLIGRARPPIEDFRVLALEIDSPYALPSGHAGTIGSVFGYYWEKFANTARFAGIIIVVLVLASRVYLGAHYIGDVLLGVLFGF